MAGEVMAASVETEEHGDEVAKPLLNGLEGGQGRTNVVLFEDKKTGILRDKTYFG